MLSEPSKLFELAQRTKTPLALAGASLIVFYLLIKQLLSLNLFSNIGSEATAAFLQGLVAYLFWLAIVTIGLGVASYLVALILSHQIRARASNVNLVDARLDPHSSDYEEINVNGSRKIQPKNRK
ncbi:hypothetical protein NIBR502774_12520 [Rhizobium sp. NIBRBAC000502774]|nr:hypothetical protein NIBR502774_12520 [Rhizobium sp. NIBRBAC000502774]